MKNNPKVHAAARAWSDSLLHPQLHTARILHQASLHYTCASLCQALLAEYPDCADALHLLGLAEFTQGHYEEAGQSLSEAIRLDPQEPHYRRSMATVLATIGELKAAEHQFGEALRLKPDYAHALHGLSIIVGREQRAPLLAQAVELLHYPGLSEEERCFLHFAAGKLHDDLGRYDQAFRHFSDGNRARRVGFDPASWEEYRKTLTHVFDQTFFTSRSARGNPDARPVFIVGMPRSGTSLVEQILASHPNVFGAGELHYIYEITLKLEDHEGRGYPECVPNLSAPQLSETAARYLDRVEALAPRPERIVDKQTGNVWHLGLIACLFPRAHIIHCLRDPLDTCLSCYFQNFANGQEYSYDLEYLGFAYRTYYRLIDHWREVLPVPILDVPYEDLVHRGEAAFREVLAFCDLEWDDACVRFHETQRPVKTLSRRQVRQPLYRTSVGRWRNYERYLGPLKAALGITEDSKE